MANLKLEHIYKVYPNGTKAVNDISLDIKDGEFIVFVGPSGCGKSTTLRMIAGLEDITAGELYIDADIVNDMEPKDRDIAMVFQNYALYPHMTVYENLAFGLKLRHIPDDQIQEKILWAADILGLKEYLDRKPRNMSGGQRQRVALGRAILRNPRVMLLDEPLSNLDAKLRTQMRTEIAKLHQRLKTTFIYVTHDQTEAMTLGNRVVVMKSGRIQQVDTPKNLYNFPANRFVAGFIGTPQMNFFDVTLLREEDTVKIHFAINQQDIEVPYNQLIKVLPSYLDGKKPITMGVRCEHVRIVDEKAPGAIKVKVSHFEELGSEALIYASLDLNASSVDAKDGQIIAKVKEVGAIQPDEEIYVACDMDATYYFDKETENTILPRIPEYNSLTASIRNNKLLVLGSSLNLPDALLSADVRNAELRVPNDAFLIGQAGIKAKVIKVEHIGDKKLAHLEADGRIFFSLVDTDYNEGADLDVALDFTRVTLIYQGQEIFSPIGEFDSLAASFYNYQTVIAKDEDPNFVQFRQDKINAAANFMDAKIELENRSYETTKAELASHNLDQERADAEKKLAELISRNNTEVVRIKTSSKEEQKRLTSEFKAAKAKAKAENDALFAEKKRREEAEFKAFRENNKDKDSLKRRSDEYHIFKDSYQTEKENTLNLQVNGLTMNFESKIAALKAQSRRQIDLLNKEIKDMKAQVKEANDPPKSLEKKHAEVLSSLEEEKENAMRRAGMVFFFQFAGGYYSMATDIISNKLIQGLGTRVFSKEFRVDMPHDAYVESTKSNAFTLTVEGNLDYGNVYFIRCKYTDDTGNEQFVFLKSDRERKIGEQIRVDFQIAKSQITETEMNIRLY